MIWIVGLIIPWSQVRVLAGPPSAQDSWRYGIEAGGSESLGVSHGGVHGRRIPGVGRLRGGTTQATGRNDLAQTTSGSPWIAPLRLFR